LRSRILSLVWVSHYLKPLRSSSAKTPEISDFRIRPLETVAPLEQPQRRDILQLTVNVLRPRRIVLRLGYCMRQAARRPTTHSRARPEHLLFPFASGIFASVAVSPPQRGNCAAVITAGRVGLLALSSGLPGSRRSPVRIHPAPTERRRRNIAHFSPRNHPRRSAAFEPRQPVACRNSARRLVRRVADPSGRAPGTSVQRADHPHPADAIAACCSDFLPIASNVPVLRVSQARDRDVAMHEGQIQGRSVQIRSSRNTRPRRCGHGARRLPPTSLRALRRWRRRSVNYRPTIRGHLQVARGVASLNRYQPAGGRRVVHRSCLCPTTAIHPRTERQQRGRDHGICFPAYHSVLSATR